MLQNASSLWLCEQDKRNSRRFEIRNQGHIPVNKISKMKLDKIFQAFFTTKPIGQGTGLDLSLAYDIVKAHGGEIKVESREGEGTEFKILLPMS